jgi:hypothetical protein
MSPRQTAPGWPLAARTRGREPSAKGLPVRSALTMEYRSRKSVLRKADLTAMVFEETAGHKPLSSATWTDRSALVPKSPARTSVS